MVEESERYQIQRDKMVREQIERRGIHNERLLKAMRFVPRHLFVPDDQLYMAYEDGPLLIGSGQTISQPYIVALMTDLLQLEGEEIVLEIGTGSGYQAAILAHLAKEVHTIERIENLSQKAARMMEKLGLENIHFHQGDGSKGWELAAPYNGILVTAAAPEVPQTLLKQLADDGRLVIPVGVRINQDLQLWQRKGEEFVQKSIIPVAFVPLRGEFGWSDGDWENSGMMDY